MATEQYVRYPTLGGGGGSGNITDINGQVGPSIAIVAGTGISVVNGVNQITVSAIGASTTENVEYHTVTSGEATAKQFNLAATPITGNKTLVDITTGSTQNYGSDFTITANVFNWSGLGLDGLLAAGDIVRLHYLS